MGVMGANIAQSKRDQMDRASLYDMMMGRAAEHGAGLRQFGEGMQQGGMALFGAGMGSAEKKGTVAPANATWENTNQSIFPMRKP